MNLILCQKYRFAYCPIPKNACTSLKYWVKSLEDRPPLNPKDVHKEEVVPHISFAAFKIDTKAQDFLKFVVLRNPYERLVSAYLDKFVAARKRDPLKWADNYWGELARSIHPSRDFSFVQFVNFVDPKSKNAFKSDQHWSAQATFCGDLDYDVYLNFAMLQTEMTKVFQKCNIPIHQRNLPLLNRQESMPEAPRNLSHLYSLTNRELCLSSYLSPELFFSPELAQIVAVKYSEDYLLYGKKCRDNQ